MDDSSRHQPSRLRLPSAPDLLVIAGATALLAARAASFSNRFLLLDDAFIAFRYARDLAHGLGLVFNPGERVEGFTSPLWTLLLAGAARLGLDLPAVSVVLSFLAAAGTVALLLRLGRRLFGSGGRGLWLAALPPLLFATMGSEGRFVFSGMETLAFVFLILWASERAVADRPFVSGLLFGLAAMTRPEGVLFALATAGWRLVMGEERWPRRWRAVARLGAGLGLVFVPFFAARWAYFGSPLPNTFYAKVAGSLGERVARGAGLLVEIGAAWSVLPLLLLALVALPGLVRRAAESPERGGAGSQASGEGDGGPPTGERGDLAPCARRAVLGLCWLQLAVATASFLAVGGDFLAFFGPRFLMPALPALLLLATAGLGALGGLASKRPPLARAVLAAGSLLLLANALWLSWPSRSELAGLAQEQEAWTRLGVWIAAHTPPDALVATGAAGLIPYYSGRAAIDMYGLTDAHIGRMAPLAGGFHPVAHEKYDPEYVLDRRPDLIVSRLRPDGLARAAGLARVADRVRRCYAPVLLAKTRGGRPPDGRWLLAGVAPDERLWEAGYQTVLLGLRQDAPDPPCAARPAAAAPLALPPPPPPPRALD